MSVSTAALILKLLSLGNGTAIYEDVFHKQVKFMASKFTEIVQHSSMAKM
jgi:hypothetical protein